MDGTTADKRRGMSDLRRHRLRLEISREASRLFWEQGVAATTGDQIARAVGLSTRTLWRHFRNKESCAEPVLLRGVEWGTSMLRDWPRHVPLEDHFTSHVRHYTLRATRTDHLDDLLAVQMSVLARTEPAIRAGWLMACDQAQRELAEIIAARVDLPADGLLVRVHAAAASAVIRAHSEYIGAALLTGADPLQFADAPRRIARAVHAATGGAVGGVSAA
ncbi:TetR/AcrR family transcriptional regulator [Streptomyces olivaceus]|uniref:TetR/AcrR family transcriptional regulator n=1 Tax=Streptomyces olivaceus TaxID=47716 RepID=UPI001CCC7057|nr:TetR/AcrR family transcriptional regulator [Streptomyces olivaceus]